MSLLLALGLATLSIIDTQQKQGAQQRLREDSFNLAEGMLYTQSQILARNWPQTVTQAFPANCTETTVTTLCMDPAVVTQSTGPTNPNPIFGGSDFQGTGAVKWLVQVRDNGNAAGQILG